MLFCCRTAWPERVQPGCPGVPASRDGCGLLAVLRKVEQDGRRYGKAAVQGGIGTSGTQPGRATSGERMVLGEVVRLRTTCRKTKAEGLLSVRWGLPVRWGLLVRSGERRGWFCVVHNCRIHCFRLFGKCEWFQEAIKQMCRGWALVQLMTQLFGSYVHELEEKYIHMFVHTYMVSLCICCRSL